MEDVRSRAKSSALPPVTAVVRQFVGSRIELQVVAQVFDVVWGASLHSSPSWTSHESSRDDSLFAATGVTAESGFTEGEI
jgi:hypothetical protein